VATGNYYHQIYQSPNGPAAEDIRGDGLGMISARNQIAQMGQISGIFIGDPKAVSNAAFDIKSLNVNSVDGAARSVKALIRLASHAKRFPVTAFAGCACRRFASINAFGYVARSLLDSEILRRCNLNYGWRAPILVLVRTKPEARMIPPRMANAPDPAFGLPR